MTQMTPHTGDDDAAQLWLGLLRTGTAEQKANARERLASIFEQRGMTEEALDLLISNVRAGVQNADIYRWIARLYRAQGDDLTAMQAAAEAAKYLPPSPPPITDHTVVMPRPDFPPYQPPYQSPPPLPPPAPMAPYQQPAYPQQQPQQQWGQPYGQPLYAPQPVQIHNVIQNNVMMRTGASHPPMILRLIYFLFFGWYIGFFWIGLALFLFLPVITFPLAIWMLNRTGYAFFL